MEVRFYGNSKSSMWDKNLNYRKYIYISRLSLIDDWSNKNVFIVCWLGEGWLEKFVRCNVRDYSYCTLFILFKNVYFLELFFWVLSCFTVYLLFFIFFFRDKRERKSLRKGRVVLEVVNDLKFLVLIISFCFSLFFIFWISMMICF